MKDAVTSYRSRSFDYSRDYRNLNLRKHPELYRVGRGEQGVLMVEPYKSEILPLWRFKTPAIALKSSRALYKIFCAYKRKRDFVGMDMTRKFIQMGFTRARRYANHPSGKKYDVNKHVLARTNEPVKAESARIFKRMWEKVEADPVYTKMKTEFKERWG